MPRKSSAKSAPRRRKSAAKSAAKSAPRKAAKKAAKRAAASGGAKRAAATAKKAPAKKAKAPAKKAPAKKAPAKRAATKKAGRITAERARPVADLGKAFRFVEQQTLHVRPRFPYARPDDLLVCEFVFDNLRPSQGRLVRVNPAREATIIVELPAQSFGEEAFLDATGPEVPSPPPPDEPFPETGGGGPDKNVAVPANDAEELDDLPFARIRMAGRSRLAFAMPSRVKGLPFTLEAILEACRQWPMRLDVNAAPEPPSRMVLEATLDDHTVFNRDWLKSAAASGHWAAAARGLTDAFGDPAETERAFTVAAKRLASRFAQPPAGRKPPALREDVSAALGAELDALARKFTPLRDERLREAAGAALTLMAAQALAETHLSDFTIAIFKDLPLLLAVFSPHEPSSNVTALELPYRLITSPIPESNWWHATKPVVRHGRTELWHTRLTKTDDGVGPDPATHVRAIWSPDYPLPQPDIISFVNADPPQPFRMSLDTLDRQMLVKLMAGFDEEDEQEKTFIPRAARARRLALSALGALLDVEGNWNQLPKGVGLEQWRHLATLGRDHYVRVVYRGFLFPFGHAASLIKVTERKFEFLDKPAQKNRVAVLRQRFFIVVREPVKTYTGAGHEHKGRNFPFTSVELLTRVTPNLRAPGLSKFAPPTGTIYTAVPDRACFWPMTHGGSLNFAFQIAATDICGERIAFALPLLFVGVEANQNDAVLKEIIDRYNLEPTPPKAGDPKPPRRAAELGGVSVCFAPPEPGAKGDPRLPTTQMVFAAAELTIGPAKNDTTKARVYPVTEEADVGIAAIRRLLQQPLANVTVSYPEIYKSKGFEPGDANDPGNPGEVFLKTKKPHPLEFGDAVKSDALGGLATPSMAIQGLSRIMGPVSAQPPPNPNPTPNEVENALGNVIKNDFNPLDFFKGAKILGGVDLADILTVAHSLAGGDVPKLLSRQLPDRLEASFEWSTIITQSDPLDLFVPTAGGLDTELKMNGVVSSPIAQPSAATFSAVASLVNFKVNLFGFIIIWFDKLSFTSKSGSKPDVNVDLHVPKTEDELPIAFGGPLEFVNELRSIIPTNGFSDPPNLSITPSGITAGYSLNIPTVAVGIFALEHVSIGASFSLPFDSRPVEVRFNFSERQRPFSLTVSLLGGGGFFAIGIGTEGVREIEAALEFGAALSINLGVASGSVEIKAGVYFHWINAADESSVELSGYVRLHGELSVLGLISASLTFNLSLTYHKDNVSGRSVVWGEASIEVEIEILFFSFSVSVKCRREFGGSNSDPKFIELIPDQATWTQYCEAFAVEA
jgi:hypothetical protein